MIFSFVILFTISAFRAPHVGTDTANYIHGFNLIASQDFESIFSIVRWEIGYTLLNKLISLVSNNSQAIIIVTSFFILFFMIYAIKKFSTNVVFSLYLFITLYYYFASFNLIRQFIAIAILLVGYEFIKERSFWKFLLTVIIASLFHQSALIFIMLYFLYGIRLNAKKIILIIFGFVFLIYSFDILIKFFLKLFPYYQVYLDTAYFEGAGLLVPLISASILLFGLFIKVTNSTDKEFDFLLIIMALSLLIGIFSMKVSLFNRFGYYTNIFNILFIPKAITSVREKKLRIIYYYVVFSITMAYFLIRFVVEGWHGVTPYEFFL